MNKIIPAIAISAAAGAAVIGAGAYLAANNSEPMYVVGEQIVEPDDKGIERTFVVFDAIEINPKTGQFDMAGVIEVLDEWIQKDKKDENKIYAEYKKMTKKERSDLLNPTSSAALNTKLKEIQDNCEQDERCVKVKVK